MNSAIIERNFVFLSYFKEYDFRIFIKIFKKLANFNSSIFDDIKDLENKLEVKLS